MKSIKLLTLSFTVLLILNSCSKDDSRPWNAVNNETLVAQSDFDWNTTKTYQLTVSGNLSRIVKIGSPKGIIYQKFFLTAGSQNLITITLPSYEKSIHLLYNNKDIELELSAPTLNYAF